ncbi:glycosyltransferase [Carboxylicivirga sp. M1479]|uniref:glycosyltransferase n=1 Tax=Carboxylicivirga sp. M1479 TaxID=2594476 RepID=UPI001178CCB4|nr:glycosyltransferase [Carboxylicivirga sp. M1479]TRX70553.1 glycosyltransferase family 4 protein [Carboxylicivirga sp. M1479]
MNILFIAYQFPPLNVGGSHRPLMFAKYLPEYGITPTIITLDQRDYSVVYTKVNRDNNQLKELSDDTHICQVKSDNLIRKRSNRFISRFPEFFNEAYYWRKDFYKKISILVSKKKYDAIFVTAPPFSILKLAKKTSKKFDVPLIVDLRDHWSLWMTTPYKSYLHYLLVKNSEKRVLQAAESIITTSLVTQSDLIKHHPSIRKSKFNYIPNGFDNQILENEKIVFNTKYEINIGYVGSFYYDPESRDMMFKETKKKTLLKKLQYTPRKEDWLYRSPYFFLKTIKQIIKNNPDFKNRIKISFAGKKENWLLQMVDDFGLSDIVNHVGWLDKQQSVEFQKKCDFLLLTSSKVINGKDYSIAGKTFEYLKLLKPVLGFVTNSAQKDLLEQLGNSLLLDPDDHIESSKKLEQVFNQNTEFILNKKFAKQFERKKQTQQLAQIIKSCNKRYH